MTEKTKHEEFADQLIEGIQMDFGHVKIPRFDSGYVWISATYEVEGIQVDVQFEVAAAVRTVSFRLEGYSGEVYTGKWRRTNRRVTAKVAGESIWEEYADGYRSTLSKPKTSKAYILAHVKGLIGKFLSWAKKEQLLQAICAHQIRQHRKRCELQRVSFQKTAADYEERSQAQLKFLDSCLQSDDPLQLYNNNLEQITDDGRLLRETLFPT